VLVIVFTNRKMGRKDATDRGNHIDKYRKKIGKHDTKKNRTITKSIKNTADAKKSAIGIKEVLLCCLTILAVLATVNLALYLWLTKPTI